MKEDSERQLNSKEMKEEKSAQLEKQIKQLNNQIFQLQTLIYKKNQTISQIQEEKNYSSIDEYLEIVKLFKFVSDHCRNKNFYYNENDPNKKRIDSDVLVEDISNLLSLLKESFQCLNKTPKKINMLGERTPSGGTSKIMNHEETPAIKNPGVSIDNKLGKILKNNFTFEVPAISMDIEEDSKKRKSLERNELPCIGEDLSPRTPDSSRKKSKQKTIFICSLEQHLSSEKRSYKIERTGENNEIRILENNEKPEIENKKAIYQNLFYKCSKQTIENTSESNVNDSQFEWTYDKNYKSLRTSELDQTESEKRLTCEIDPNQFGLKNSTLMQIESRRFIENGNFEQGSLAFANENNLLSKKECEEVIEENRRLSEDLEKNEGNFQLKIKKKPLENFSFNYNQPSVSKESKTIDESFVNIAKTTQNSKNNIFKENSNGFKNSSFQVDYQSDKDIISQEKFSKSQTQPNSIESNFLNKNENLSINSNNQFFRKKEKKLDIEHINIYPSPKSISTTSHLTLQSTFNYQRKCINSSISVENPMTIWYQPKKKREEIKKKTSIHRDILSKKSMSSILNTSYSILSKQEGTLCSNKISSIPNYQNERKKRKKSKNKRKSTLRTNRSFNGSSIGSETSLYSKYMKIFQKSNLAYKSRKNYNKKIQEIKNKMKPKTPNGFMKPSKYSSRTIRTGFRKLKKYKQKLIGSDYESYRLRNKSSRSFNRDNQKMYSSKYEHYAGQNENYLLN
jgi:hypothetical protein